MRTAALFLSLALVSCQPGSDNAVDPNNPDTMNPDNKPPIKIVPQDFQNKNGSRLKYGYNVARSADGLALATSPFIRDTKLNFNCYTLIPYYTEDQRQRCLPQSDYASAYRPLFTDAACSQIAFGAGLSAGTPRFGLDGSAMNGMLIYRVFEIGSQMTIASLHLKDGTTCRALKPEEMTTYAGLNFFASKRQMDPSEFAELTTELVIQ